MSEKAHVLIEIDPSGYHDDMDIDYLVGDWLRDNIDGDAVAEIWDDDGQMMGELRITYGPSMYTRGYLDLDAWVEMVETIIGDTRTVTKTAR